MLKHFYYILLLTLPLLGCEKILLDGYKGKFYGSWHITAIRLISANGDYSGLHFKKGSNVVFLEDGTINYTEPAGNIYKGTWVADMINNPDCYTNSDGSSYCSDDWTKTLQLNATLPSSKSAYFHTVNFVNKDHFNALIQIDYFTSYEYQFKR